jgi:hypothetical protein
MTARSRIAAGIVVCVAAMGLAVAAAPPAQLDELEPVVIVGGYATPQMWKISKGGHVMWLLVISTRAPAGTQWRTQPLESRVAESQLVLYASPGVGYSWRNSFSEAIADRRETNKAEHLPGKDSLKDVLPPDIYARWRVLKSEYIGSGDAVERRCPACAMEELERKVMKRMPAAAPTGPALQPLVDKAAKKYKVKTRKLPEVIRPVEFTQAEEAMSRLQYVMDLGDVKCFTQRLDYLERLIKYRDQQAIATVRRALTQGNPIGRCYSDTDWPTRWVPSGKLPDPAAAQSMSDKISLQMKLAWQQVDAQWMAAAQEALAKNQTTFAVHRVEPWGHPGSYINQLRDLGYEVEEPGGAVE